MTPLPESDDHETLPRRPVAGVMVLLASLAVMLGVVAHLAFSRPVAAPDIEGLLWPAPAQVGPFALADHHGRAFDRERLEGRWTLMFFGYTHCPDVCPITLSVFQQTARLLDEAGDTSGVQFVFVSVDPERDTLEHLAHYVGYFDDAFLGVTGEHEALRGLTRQLGVLYHRNEPNARGDYLVDHSAGVFLLDPEGRMVGLFRAPHQANDIAARLRGIRDFVARG